MNVGNILQNRYVIEKHIGRGGMQDVYLALDTLLYSRVAVKTPQPGQASTKFSKSAIIAARINHHNVAKTLDYFEADGNPFIVEEYVEGENLEVKIQRFGAVDPHLAARVFHHLTKGVAASHHAGVVHRDLKPSNIIVEPGVNIHRLKITDFGISTLTEEVFADALERHHGDMTKSNSGTIRGALPYMAPEVMFPDPGNKPGQAIDIWSVGALMFRIATGTHPFGTNLNAAVNVRMKNRAPWPKFMTSHEQYQALSIDIQKIIELCLQYDPGARPTADTLIDELSKLTYINVDRREGTVSHLIQNGRSGFVDDETGSAFFSTESIYNPSISQPLLNSVMCYSRFPGQPRERCHPIVVFPNSHKP